MSQQNDTYKSDNIVPCLHSHTPGPWKADETHSKEWEGVTVWSGDVVIAHVVEDQHMNAINNARIISIAPTLLNTCEDLLHQLSTDSDLENITGAAKYKALEIRLKEVIAAATGQAYEAPQQQPVNTNPVILEVMRGADYQSFDEAWKDGAIYSKSFNNLYETQIAIEGAKLASLCISNDINQLQFKTTQKENQNLTVDDVNRELDKHFTKENPLLPNQQEYLTMLCWSKLYSDAIENINNWSKGLPTTVESVDKLHGYKEYIHYKYEAATYESVYRTEYKDLIKSIVKNGSFLSANQSNLCEIINKEGNFRAASRIRNAYLSGKTVSTDIYVTPDCKITNPETIKLMELCNKEIIKQKDFSR